MKCQMNCRWIFTQRVFLSIMIELLQIWRSSIDSVRDPMMIQSTLDHKLVRLEKNWLATAIGFETETREKKTWEFNEVVGELQPASPIDI